MQQLAVVSHQADILVVNYLSERNSFLEFSERINLYLGVAFHHHIRVCRRLAAGLLNSRYRGNC